MKKIMIIFALLLVLPYSINFAVDKHFEIDYKFLNENLIEGRAIGYKKITYKCINDDYSRIVAIGEISTEKSSDFVIDLGENLDDGKYIIWLLLDDKKIKKEFYYKKDKEENIFITSEKRGFKSSDLINIGGYVENPSSEFITLKVLNDAKTHIINLDQIKLENGKFKFKFFIPYLTDNGRYFCILKNGDSEIRFNFSIEKRVNSKKKDNNYKKNEDKKIESKDSINRMLLELKNSDNALDDLTKINTTISRSLENLDKKNSLDLFKRHTDAVRRALDKTRISLYEIQNLVDQMIVNNFNLIKPKFKVESSDYKKMKFSMIKTINKVLEETNSYEISNSDDRLSNKFVLSQRDIKSIIKKFKE